MNNYKHHLNNYKKPYEQLQKRYTKLSKTIFKKEPTRGTQREGSNEREPQKTIKNVVLLLLCVRELNILFVLQKQRMEPKVSPPLGPHAAVWTPAPMEGARAFFLPKTP